jgi:hypothetical protein
MAHYKDPEPILSTVPQNMVATIHERLDFAKSTFESKRKLAFRPELILFAVVDSRSDKYQSESNLATFAVADSRREDPSMVA